MTYYEGIKCLTAKVMKRH